MEEIWIPGRRVEKALHADGQRVVPWRDLLPDLASGRLRVRFETVRFGVEVSDTLPGQGRTVQIFDIKHDFDIPIVAWITTDRRRLKGSFSGCEGWHSRDALSDVLDVRALDTQALIYFEGAGAQFERASVISVYDFDHEKVAILDARPQKSAQASEISQRRSGAGRKLDTERWMNFAAALGVLAGKGELDLENQAAMHEAVASYLMEKGIEDSLGLEAVRPMLRRFAYWTQGLPMSVSPG